MATRLAHNQEFTGSNPVPATNRQIKKIKGTRMEKQVLAQMAHELNAVICRNNNQEAAHWDDAPQWQKDSSLSGIEFALAHPDVTPEMQHNEWMDYKIKDGWKYGEKKDAEAKTHPCLVPFGELPKFERAKDAVFIGVAKLFSVIN